MTDFVSVGCYCGFICFWHVLEEEVEEEEDFFC